MSGDGKVSEATLGNTELDAEAVMKRAADAARERMGVAPAPKKPDAFAALLRDASLFAGRKPPPSVCDTCKRELTLDEHPRFRRGAIVCAPCFEVEEDARRRNRGPGMLPESFQWASFEAPELEQRVRLKSAIGAARAAVRVPRVVFMGPAGSGKSSLAAAALLERYIDTGEAFSFAPAYLLSIARSRHKLGEGDPPEIRAAIEVPMLLIDDLGFEKPGPTSVGDLEVVIYERHLRARPTWVTTWQTSAQARERYGDGIARRLFEGATVIQCGGAK